MTGRLKLLPAALIHAGDADALADLGRGFRSKNIGPAEFIARLERAMDHDRRQSAEMWQAAQIPTTAWPEFRTGQRIKRGQGGRRKRSRRNCRRYPVDLSEFEFFRWSGNHWIPVGWYWSNEPGFVNMGPFDSEREARADARKRVS